MCTQLCNWTSTVSLWGVGYGVLVSDPKSWIEALHKFILLRSICHSFVTTGPQTGGFLLSPPREDNRGKSVKLEVDVDKHRGDRFSPLGSGNWFVSLRLSPRGMFPCSRRKPLRPYRGGAGSTSATGSPQGTAERRALQSHLTMCQFPQR